MAPFNFIITYLSFIGSAKLNKNVNFAIPGVCILQIRYKLHHIFASCTGMIINPLIRIVSYLSKSGSSIVMLYS